MSDAQAVHDRAVAVQRDVDLAAVVATAAPNGEKRRRRPGVRWRRARREQPCPASPPVPACNPLG